MICRIKGQSQSTSILTGIVMICPGAFIMELICAKNNAIMPDTNATHIMADWMLPIYLFLSISASKEQESDDCLSWQFSVSKEKCHKQNQVS